jgi:hypothetical protein
MPRLVGVFHETYSNLCTGMAKSVFGIVQNANAYLLWGIVHPVQTNTISFFVVPHFCDSGTSSNRSYVASPNSDLSFNDLEVYRGTSQLWCEERCNSISCVAYMYGNATWGCNRCCWIKSGLAPLISGPGLTVYTPQANTSVQGNAVPAVPGEYDAQLRLLPFSAALPGWAT